MAGAMVLVGVLLMLQGTMVVRAADGYSYEDGPGEQGEDPNTMMPDMYCGQHNCYDILGVTREDEQNTIRKAFRKMSLK
jgi:hypothetical protein